MANDRLVPLRGRVFDVDTRVGRKPFVVVSNNARNRALPTVLVVRLTTAPKPAIPSIVELPHGEPVIGRALCDDIVIVGRAELLDSRGALSARAMAMIGDGLRAALALQ